MKHLSILCLSIGLLPVKRISAINLNLAARQPRQRAFDRAMRINKSGGTLGRYGERECVDAVKESYQVWKWILFSALLLFPWSIVFCVVWFYEGNINIKIGSIGSSSLLSIGLLVMWIAGDPLVFRGYFMFFHPAICE